MGRRAIVERAPASRASPRTTRRSIRWWLLAIALVMAALAAASRSATPARADTTDTAGAGEATRGVLGGIHRQRTRAVRIVGRVAYETGVAAPEVVAELFATAGGDDRGALLRSQATRSDGSFRFHVRPGCYAVTVVAPATDRIVGSGPVATSEVCVDAEHSPAIVRIFLEGDEPQTSSLSRTELELLRLTNLLRADPDGHRRRQGPLPDCVFDPFYRIVVDPRSGSPEPAPPLGMSEMAATALARSWAIEMALTGSFRHRPSAAQQQILTSLDLPVTAWGENIAWFAGYPMEDTAGVHFEGWRESETSHYCTLISPRFTHVGIGEFRMGDESWAVQNFYTTGDVPAEDPE